MVEIMNLSFWGLLVSFSVLELSKHVLLFKISFQGQPSLDCDRERFGINRERALLADLLCCLYFVLKVVFFAGYVIC